MRSPAATLRIAAPALVVLAAVEAVVSIAARWPHQFAGQGSREHVFAEFVGAGGTALAPPLVLLILLALLAAGVQLAGRWRAAATVLLVPVSAVMTVGAAGEALAAPTPDVPYAVLVAGGTVGALLSVALLVLAIGALVVDRRKGAAAPSPHGARQHELI